MSSKWNWMWREKIYETRSGLSVLTWCIASSTGCTIPGRHLCRSLTLRGSESESESFLIWEESKSGTFSLFMRKEWKYQGVIIFVSPLDKSFCISCHTSVCQKNLQARKVLIIKISVKYVWQHFFFLQTNKQTLAESTWRGCMTPALYATTPPWVATLLSIPG